MNSKLIKSETKLPVRMSFEFSKVCRLHSIKYPGCPVKCGSAAHFLKEAAKEKLIKIGVPVAYVKSLR